MSKMYVVSLYFCRIIKQQYLYQTIKIFQTKMTEQDPSLSQSQSFLPLNSMDDIKLRNSSQKKQKISKLGNENSLLFQQLRKVGAQETGRKRECIIKYLKQEGEMKDTSKIIPKIQEEGHAIPILEVAIALSRYDNQFLKELLDSKTIEMKETKQEALYELNKKLQSDPILSLLSDSEQLKRIPNQQKQPSFLDFKQISPKKKHELIDFQKGKLKKIKTKSHSHVEYPKQLQALKKELFSLPYINQYKKQLSLKRDHKYGKSLRSTGTQLTKFSQLNSCDKQFGSLQKSLSKINQKEVSLEKSLSRALIQRNKYFQISSKGITLQKVESVQNRSLSKEFHNSSVPNKQIFDTIVSKDKSTSSTMKNTGKNSFINPQDEEQSQLTEHTIINPIKNKSQSQYWPLYQKYSPHNRKYVFEIEKLKSKVRSFTELSEIPSEETLSMYASLKSLEVNDLKKLQKHSVQQERAFSNTKYKIKYKNIKENYSRRLKQFIKDRKVRQFELQQHDLDQRSNLSTKIVKLNDKMLEKISLKSHQI